MIFWYFTAKSNYTGMNALFGYNQPKHGNSNKKSSQKWMKIKNGKELKLEEGSEKWFKSRKDDDIHSLSLSSSYQKVYCQIYI